MAQNTTGKLPLSAGKSQYYGETELLKQRQRAVPMGQSPGDVVARRGAQQQQQAQARPGSLPPLTRPTDRPSEPITSGAPFGQGPGPLQAGILPVSVPSPVLDEIKALGMMFPASGILDLVDKYGNT